MKKTLLSPSFNKIYLPIAVVLCSIALSFYMRNNPQTYSVIEQTSRKEVAIETITITPTAYRVSLQSQGTIQSSRLIRLISQVRGQIIYVSDKFQSGESVSEGELLLKVDPTEIMLEIEIAMATLSKADLDRKLAESKSKQAQLDWKRMNRKGQATQLAVMEPQRLAAQAAYKSAQARLKIAQINLEKSQIHAPFDGRVLDEQRHQVGQYISPGAMLGELYSDRELEIRLPLSAMQLVNISKNVSKYPSLVSIELSRTVNGMTQKWSAQLSHIEGKADPSTRRQYIIADLDLSDAEQPPAVGLFASATISAQSFNNVFVIPRDLVSPRSTIVKVVDGKLVETPIHALYKNESDVVIRNDNNGIQTGDAIVAQSLGANFNDVRVSAIHRKRPFGEVPKVYGLTSTPDTSTRQQEINQ